MSMFSSLKAEIEFVAGAWTDVSSYVSGDVTIGVGRPTPYDQVAPTEVTLMLHSGDGRFIPENSSGPYYPNVRTGVRVRISLVKAGVTYVRATVYATAFELDFPGASAADAVVTVTAYDALSIMGSRIMRDYWTEKIFYLTRAAGSWAESYRLASSLAGGVTATADVYVEGLAAASGTATATIDSEAPAMTFADSETYGTTSEGTLLIPSNRVPATSGPSHWDVLRVVPHTSPQTFGIGVSLHNTWDINSTWWEYICAGYISGSFTFYMAWTWTSGSPSTIGLHLRNSGGTDIAYTTFSTVGEFASVEFRMNQTTNTSMDWVVNGSTLATMTSCDVRNMTRMDIGGCSSVYIDYAYAQGFRNSTSLSATHRSQTGQTLGAMLTAFQNAVSDISASFAVAGSDNGRSVYQGYWSGMTALNVARMLCLSAGGFVWARTDGTVLFVLADTASPLTPLLTFDLDYDAQGMPTVLLSDDTRPTRVTVTTPVGSVTAIDSVSEAVAPAGRRKDQSISTLTTSDADSLDIAWSRMLSTSRSRFAEVTIDLMAASTDFTATLLSTSGTTGALFPTQRVRVNVASTLFGVPSKDLRIYGWTETYNQEEASIRLDCTAAMVATVTGGTCVGGTGTGTIIVTTDAPLPTSTQAYPLDFDWAGERITCSAPGGATSPQTFTCTARGVTGGTAATSHASGTSIDAWISGA
jgi:hypothetical protein